ncbi:TMV resistance protein N [Amborella trichopoda]|uniref:TMV resistance protein N n=1 Tax=Amborella trichopoda TaxID=13333 RepID=UPI0009C15569|nr:TMV resistance protein N [Amborella trichopoda]|eukprot:XP_020528644.1 TMV resistance protein N [Amborella trichopoda]
MKLMCKTPLHVVTYPVGLNPRVGDVMRHLEIDANDVRMIGIHGMGGIGKATLAKEVFNKIRSQFHASCFLLDVRESSKINGVVDLQRQLLKELFDEEDPSIYNADQGINVIKNKIGSKKVLVVFDDIDDDKQLEKLAGNRDWYCQGSRIIITTRDEHVLNVHNRVDSNHIYKLEVLDRVHSLELFSWCAFQSNQPIPKFVQLSKDVISTACGLPLALEVLGCYLCDKLNIEEWEDAIMKLKTIPADDVMRKLKISYDDLSEEEKHMFLDIACFFIGEKRDYTINIWKCCGFPASISIKKLLQRSLIKIEDGDELQMHDQLRDMGRRIVELENLDDHGKRSRLWFRGDVITVLKNHKGTRKVRGLMISGIEDEKIWETEAFKAMNNLKLLSIRHACLNGSLKDLSSELVWLEITEHPWQYLPENCSCEKLAVLDLTNSNTVSKNNIKQPFPKLKVLDLTRCLNLERIPDCSQYMNLKQLILEGCKSLVEIPDSIGLLRDLVYLNLEGCSNLKKLPENFGQLTSLRTLNLNNNSNLTRLPSTFSGLCSLKELFANACNLQGVIADDFEKLPKLKKLNLSRNKNIQGLPRSMRGLSQLEEMRISFCEQLVTIPELPNSLKCLYANLCYEVQTMPELSHLSQLKTLYLAFCKQLIAIPELPTSLNYLDVSHCVNLLAIGNLSTTLESLKASHCISLQIIPDLSQLSQLEELDLTDCKGLIEIQGLSGLKSLKTLHLHGCGPHALRGLTLAEEIFAGLECLTVPGSKVPNWFQVKWITQDSSVSYRVSGVPDEGKYIRGLMLCFATHSGCTYDVYPVELLMKSENGVNCIYIITNSSRDPPTSNLFLPFTTWPD